MNGPATPALHSRRPGNSVSTLNLSLFSSYARSRVRLFPAQACFKIMAHGIRVQIIVTYVLYRLSTSVVVDYLRVILRKPSK